VPLGLRETLGERLFEWVALGDLETLRVRLGEGEPLGEVRGDTLPRGLREMLAQPVPVTLRAGERVTLPLGEGVLVALPHALGVDVRLSHLVALLVMHPVPDKLSLGDALDTGEGVGVNELD